MVSHETADGVLRAWGVPPGPAAGLADRLNRRSAWAYSRIVCTTRWAEREFLRIGARNVVRAPLGVDLRRRRPDQRDDALRAHYARGADVLLLLCSRLSVEKRPGMALDTLAVLRHRGVRAALVVAGDGPLRRSLERRARELRLPVDFVGHIRARQTLAGLQAAADVCLVPGPAETFGLSALEALACGTPVVVSASSALPEVVAGAGVAARDTPEAFAAAVQAVLSRPSGCAAPRPGPGRSSSRGTARSPPSSRRTTRRTTARRVACMTRHVGACTVLRTASRARPHRPRRTASLTPPSRRLRPTAARCTPPGRPRRRRAARGLRSWREAAAGRPRPPRTGEAP